MTRLFLAAFVLLLGIAGKAQSFEDMPEYANVDGWTIRIDTTLGNGCFLHTYFKGGTALLIGKDNKRNTLYVVVGNPHWDTIKYGKHYPIEIQFGDKNKWFGDASGMSFNPPENQPFFWFYLNADIESATVFLGEFMRERTVEFFFDGSSITKLSLKGSHRATLKLMECQRSVDEQTEKEESFAGRRKVKL